MIGVAIEATAIDLDTLTLHKGGHEPGDVMCILEAVAMFAGEEWSDHPQCASPVIAAFLRSWNDGLQDVERQALKVYILPLVGSRGTAEQENARSWMAADWLVRTHTPAWLRLAGLTGNADVVEALPELRSVATARAACKALGRARKDAVAAALAAAGAAAWDEKREATQVAAQAITWAGGGAAWAAVRHAKAAVWDGGAAAQIDAWDAAQNAALAVAGAAAWEAPWDDAWDAAQAALTPTVATLQASAHLLVAQMIAHR